MKKRRRFGPSWTIIKSIMTIVQDGPKRRRLIIWCVGLSLHTFLCFKIAFFIDYKFLVYH